ncbi:PP2C family protein-serine/threonine phosphatase [Pseudooceanicola sp. MF1-13]|uniref:PP2C family protein-serine/threonine phosphatase n=1 Tax=Pseudooceanicola sp. MF1-13 TaxID=3379095 RepID=UPI0038923ED2
MDQAEQVRRGRDQIPAAGQARRVLVVDDSKMQRRILSVSLARWGYEVLEAGTGEEAIELCAKAPPDIVISDWMMPGLTGPEFCQAFRAMPRDNYGYFILLTSKADKLDVAEGLTSGADDFLTKPVNSGELRARLIAGDRVHRMHWDLTRKNRVIEETLHELQQLYDSIDNDLIEAKKLQQSLVREREVRVGPARIAQILRTAGRVGGDLVGYYPVGPNRVVVYALDVSGHGVSSALMTARLAGVLSPAMPQQNIGVDMRGAQGPVPVAPDRIAARLNRIALQEMDNGHYFTLALAEVDLTTGALRMVQAGHPHPMIQRADGRIDVLGQGGFPIGLVDEAEFDIVTDRLMPGDRLVLMSDGATECTDEHGQMLEEEGLIALLQSLSSLSGIAMLEALVWSLSDRREDGRFEDDVSAITLDYTPA